MSDLSSGVLGAGMRGVPDPDEAALLQVVHGRSTASLLVDLATGTVLYANPFAQVLAPGLATPVPLTAWSRGAGLRTVEGLLLEDSPTPLVQVVDGAPLHGVQVRSASTDVPLGADPTSLLVVGVPLADAPGDLAGRALILLLPVHQEATARLLRGLGGDLHARAAVASGLSFTISDPNRTDDPLIWVNPAFERLTGYVADDVIGRNCRMLQGARTDRTVVGRIRTALDAGHTVADTILNYRKDGTPFWNQVVISPVFDADGHLTHHVGIQADVTARVESERARDAALGVAQAARARSHLLAQVSEELARRLDYDDALVALAEIAVSRLATWGFVVVTNERGRLERIHVAARHPVRAQDAQDLERGDPSWLMRSTAFELARTDDSRFDARPFSVDVDALAATAPAAQLEVLRRLGLGSALAVPLRARDHFLGALCLLNDDVDGFTAEDVVTAGHLGQRAGMALDNVRLYLRERSAALTLQHSLLPDVPTVPGLDIAASYLPALHRAEVGGDWFDVLPLPDGAIGLAVGDVVGHDLQAAASMGQLRSVLRSHAWSGARAGRVIAHLDELVRGLGMADVATCVYLRLELPSGPPGPRADGARPADRLTYSRAGHPPPLIRLPGGEVRSLDGALTTPVGVVNLRSPDPQAEVELPFGAILVVYTDGLLERRDRSLRDGIAELECTLRALPDDVSAADVRDRLVARFVGSEQEDDVCVLVVRRPAAPAGAPDVSPGGPATT
ncbi:SpoIIE family protein phosphatase [Cellulomonas sp. P22]|uniref:SpoIIE family protein phosphatase n=1 Tax=Cellulomonas sp. P22 TaxID=3373189 RepID=UPI0037AD9A19